MQIAAALCNDLTDLCAGLNRAQSLELVEDLGMDVVK